MLFVDFSSAFHTVIPHKLVCKLNILGISSSICTWILDILTKWPLSVKFGKKTSSTLMLSTGTPQGCGLSPMIYTRFTYDSNPICLLNSTVKFVDDTAIVSLISKENKADYRWCKNNKPDMQHIEENRRSKVKEYSTLLIQGERMEIVESFKFALISSLSKESSKDFFFEESLGRPNSHRSCCWTFTGLQLSPSSLIVPQSGIPAALLMTGITWSSGEGSTTPRGHGSPRLDPIYDIRMRKKAHSIYRDCTHSGQALFEPLPSGRRFRAIKAKTNSFYLRAAASITPHLTDTLQWTLKRPQYMQL